MTRRQLTKIIVILGPTASGKTDLSIRLAQWLIKDRERFFFSGVDILSADSRQVYKGMDLGTGKITAAETQGIPHHLIDIASPKKKFSVAQYQKKALRRITKIRKRNNLPILVGGSPFYIYSLTEGWSFPQLKPNWKLRKELERQPLPALLRMLQEKDPRRAEEIEKKNKRRIIRAIEIAQVYGNVPLIKKEKKFQTLFLGLKRDKTILNKRIKQRLTKRFSQGMIKEVKKLRKQGLSWQRLEGFGLEYRWISRYLRDKIGYQDMVISLQKDIEHFAKRQMTWFKKDKRIKWISTFLEAKKQTELFLKK